MKTIKIFTVLSSLLLISALKGANAQADLPPEELEEYRLQAQSLVETMVFYMNTIGAEGTTANEKEIIINQSYNKIFRDDEVQVEDDLDERRDVVTNKDVQAYLKDIDFFYKDVEFEYNILDISHYVKEDGQLFFKVTADRNLQGVTIDQDTVNANLERFIEINLDRQERDLKIASIYTTRLSEEEALTNWWNGLDYEWQATFKRELAILEDTLSLSQVKRMAELTELDISGNDMVQDLAPLSKLRELRVLNLSNTNISDLTPIRNLTKLQVLKLSGTPVTTLAPLKYASSLTELYINGTLIADLTSVQNFPLLEKLHCYTLPIKSLRPISVLANLKDLRFQDTPVSDLAPVSSLLQMEVLHASYTSITDLTPLNTLSKLERLYIDHTQVADLSPLRRLPNLKLLFCDNTNIKSLVQLIGMQGLERVYCDNTPISRQEASRFMLNNPGTLVIFNSTNLFNWWQSLNADWKNVFSQLLGIREEPTKEELQTLANLSSLNISGNAAITSLKPVTEFMGLKRLNAAGTQIADLTPLSGLRELEVLDVSQTQVAGEALSALKGLSNLEELYVQNTKVGMLPFGNLDALQTVNCNNTQIADLMPLAPCKNLRTIYCEGTAVEQDNAVAFVMDHPQTLVIFRTEQLKKWWEGMDDTWKEILAATQNLTGSPNPKQLHALSSITTLEITDRQMLTDLSPLSSMINLRELILKNTGVSNLAPISGLGTLRVLVCNRSPLKSLAPVSGLYDLKQLSIENTPIEDLDAVANLKNLEILRCSGTQIKRLDPLEGLSSLRIFECFNTDVKNLKPLHGLPSLQLLVVYNTRANERRVEKFKEDQPNCEVVFY